MPYNSRLDKSAMFTMRVNPEVKEEAAELFASFGLTLSDAVNLFLHQAIQEGGIPFEIRRKQAKKEDAQAE